ncbi:MAG: hypothetical protein ABWZ25_16705 [Chitinophagaceae bacterium]
MIQLLAIRYPRQIAFILLSIFLSGFLPVYGTASIPPIPSFGINSFSNPNKEGFIYSPALENGVSGAAIPEKMNLSEVKMQKEAPNYATIDVGAAKQDIGGPGQPEMSSFKSVGADNMVDLFTGDFSYNIPLMDVGGYPINLFYNGGITMEQEASWVGLGFNINPGTVSRNMRGVPDDFNGEDTLIQTQKMKPNKTWGASIGADFELVGIKGTPFADFTGSAGFSVGISVNNYLGPALELSAKGTTNLSIGLKTNAEKNASLGISGGLSANLSSRNGLTVSPNVSLSASAYRVDRGISFGIGLSTSYNSRSGIKALQIQEQMAYNYDMVKRVGKGARIYNQGSMNPMLPATTISFAKPSYIPSIRLPITNTAYTGHFQFGPGIFGAYTSVEAEGYMQTAEIDVQDQVQRKPLVGYLNYQKAGNNPNAVMDFTRFNDNEVTPHTPIISVPQYTYDVFSIQGEGTGGTIRAYRNDQGYVRDNYTRTKDKSLSIGGDIGVPGHFGANLNTMETPSTIKEWDMGNKLRNSIYFREAKDSFENVYFRNPGETSVLNKGQYDSIGGTDLVRFKLGGSNYLPAIEPTLEKFSRSNNATGEIGVGAHLLQERKKRTQTTSFLTAEEASKMGLDLEIKSYNATTILDNNNNLQYDLIKRVGGYRKKHHISQINVTEADGRRYIYGIPAYNVKQTDFSFSVNGTGDNKDQVSFAGGEPNNINTSVSKEGFIQKTNTPAYAHSFLLTGLLSPDYVDVRGDGITEDDLGGAVKFNYTRIKSGGNWADYRWRTPLNSGFVAHFNAGKLSESKDDKGVITYGERESWYVHSIESKTMIALFTLEDRADGKGAIDSISGINTNDKSLKRLKKIDLYSKADLKKNGLQNAKSIKTVWFAYSYSLCANAPGNDAGAELINGQNVNVNKGKLTLDSIYFTYNGKNRINKNKYVFSYAATGIGNPTGADNPAYDVNASDRWGNYKPTGLNPGTPGLKNSEYPYSNQDKTKTTTLNQNAGAWSLKRILLPSGGQLQVDYEGDDYAFVQNRRAAGMMEIAGLGKDADSFSDKLYGVSFDGMGKPVFIENDVVFIKVPDTCSTPTVFNKYLQGVNQLAFKVAVVMPKGIEYVSSYASIAGYGVDPKDSRRIWVRVNRTDNLSPLALTALEYLREQLPGQAFPGYDVSESTGLKQVGEMLIGMLSGLNSAFQNPLDQLRGQGLARYIIPGKSFVRLNDPDGYKYGGGHRVRSVKLKDNWQAMTGRYTSEYGQEYSYETTEIFNGDERKISSGVASYEPSIGGEENPFQSIVQVSNKLPLGPNSYGAIEMPVMDAFFPAPLVGYSKVTVRSNKRGDIPADKKSRSGIGKQVTEFFTAKDFPVYYNNTGFDNSTDKQQHDASFSAFFYKYKFDSRALSQGFLVETNDMHGKIKSQSSYPENDSLTRISYTENFYRNTGAKGLQEEFDFVHGLKGGVIDKGNMGIDVELMTDTREFSVESKSLEIQGQLDLYPVIVTFWLPFIWGVAGNSVNNYRAVTTTKVINYHGILDSVVVVDKGSRVTTKNMVYDAQTGNVVVSKINNEFDRPVYQINYPAYWAYSGMGLAYKNIDAVFNGVNFRDGRIASGIPAADINKYFESGDELFLLNPGVPPTDNCGSKLPSSNDTLLWAFDRNKNIGALTITTPDMVFINKSGKLSNRDNVSFRIVRSGKRNMLGATVAGISTMTDPTDTIGSVRVLKINAADKVINAASIEYREKWQADNDIFKKMTSLFDPNTCTSMELLDCNGYLEKSINPYCKGLLGSFMTNRSMAFYGARTEINPLTKTDLKHNGFLKDFKLYWDFDVVNNLVPDNANSKWVWNSQVTKVNGKGLTLETKDALNIYSSAQYGYNKTTPVAIANNARYDEICFEGFEDKEYQENINIGDISNCGINHIDFTDIANSQVVKTALLNFNAHSGNYSLKLNPNTAAVKTIVVGQNDIDSFSLVMKNDAIKALNDPGGATLKLSSQPSNAPIVKPDIVVSNLGLSIDFPVRNVIGEIAGNTIVYAYMYKTTQYTKIATPNTYTFNLSTFQHDVPLGYPEEYIFNKSAITVTIKKLNGERVASFNCYSTESPKISSVFLTCDTYLIETLCSVDLQRPITGGGDGFHAFSANFTYTSNLGTTSYQSLDAENLCYFTKPLATSDSMLNPVFNVPANKKMLFSAWVRENCDNRITNCTSKVTLQFNSGGSQLIEFKPSGPIIEGWQRYEGAFTAPADATQMTLSLVNNSSQPIYFDDIRIHPFNANMKSYVYDPINLRLTAELDANNYAVFYEYDEEGTLVRTKAETKEGVKTINETRSFKQRAIKEIH